MPIENLVSTQGKVKVNMPGNLVLVSRFDPKILREEV